MFLFLSIIATAATFTPTPLFLKQGFSTVLEFETVPKRIVLGDPQGFQVEKLDRSLILRPLLPYAATNMFVYLEGSDAKLFLLKASEEAEPTLYRKFEELKVPAPIKIKATTVGIANSGLRLTSHNFDAKKDYLTLDLEVFASSKIVPNWELARLKYKDAAIVPIKVWAQRKEVQKDAKIKCRLIFAKPNIPRNLKGISVVIPLLGAQALVLNIGGI